MSSGLSNLPLYPLGAEALDAQGRALWEGVMQFAREESEKASAENEKMFWANMALRQSEKTIANSINAAVEFNKILNERRLNELEVSLGLAAQPQVAQIAGEYDNFASDLENLNARDDERNERIGRLLGNQQPEEMNRAEGSKNEVGNGRAPNYRRD